MPVWFFERHATSKIREAADLFAPSYYGLSWRGFAHRCRSTGGTLKNLFQHDGLGTFIQISGSQVEKQEAVA